MTDDCCSKCELCACDDAHLVHAHFFEGDLQQLEVVDIFMLQFGSKLDLLQGNRVLEEHVHELAVRSS